MGREAYGDGEGEPSGGDMNGEGDRADTGAGADVEAFLCGLFLCERARVWGKRNRPPSFPPPICSSLLKFLEKEQLY